MTYIPLRYFVNAAEDDFSQNVVNITFPADEEGPLESHITVNIPLIDDVIDEADIEYFILYLTQTGSALPGLRLDTVISVAGINDDECK